MSYDLEALLGSQTASTAGRLDRGMLREEYRNWRRGRRKEQRAMASTSKEIALVPASEYAIVSMDSEAQEIIRKNIGEAGIGEFDLDRYKVPTGGSTTWEHEEGAKGEIQAVIVGYQDARTFWREPFGGGGESGPPDCMSRDLVHGEGDPGGLCQTCPYNQWGSISEVKGKGKGKACREVRKMIFVEPGDVLPKLLVVPPSSLKPVRTYFLRLAGKQVGYWQTTTRIRLQRTKSSDSIDYAQVQMTMGERLDPAVAAKIGKMAETFAPTLEAAPIDPQDVTGE